MQQHRGVLFSVPRTSTKKMLCDAISAQQWANEIFKHKHESHHCCAHIPFPYQNTKDTLPWRFNFCHFVASKYYASTGSVYQPSFSGKKTWYHQTVKLTPQHRRHTVKRDHVASAVCCIIFALLWYTFDWYLSKECRGILLNTSWKCNQNCHPTGCLWFTVKTNINIDDIEKNWISMIHKATSSIEVVTLIKNDSFSEWNITFQY